ncbi:MAG: TIGR04283 family arsenosugar biosynthesis glycosyltransferase [Pegethrix bostrychoides GSE-TBD4-15B]|uniref:4,4'-diaponeurosporenoate glycosyltransferase n=1 Tax=Pegethrix bostrychoides GSE-TBD4-15B TaxID=2839662 RepID=A0A951PGU4_9CYAN|nr:TIGR04283 family arsenosugar biosynthesis glycosyltransferase [Pegethrix bostrychoides GSE-TBD4-15B]
MSRRLLLFTRYPEPGMAKTRLIPALGAAGAADLHRQMVEQTLAEIQRLQIQSLELEAQLSVEIWFASRGNSAEEAAQTQNQMRNWLGDWCYRAQPQADLGTRLSVANQAAFDAGMQQVITVGSDCPGLRAELMQQAFELLEQHDLVLGPAQDGGYYLIGLRRCCPELFCNITWSSEWVLQQTVEIATRLRLSTAYLPTLADVDRPEDLAVWQANRLSQAPSASKPAISVIIPVLNEANGIERVIQALQTQTLQTSLEVIVVDGGSCDETVALASALGVQVILAEQGRAAQMNAGAKVAAAEILLFLHADSILPPQFVASVQQVLAQPNTIAGAFELRIAAPEPSLRWIERGVNWRSRWLQLPYGDQAIFLKAKTFRQLGGFAQLPIMEDFELVRRLQKLGKIAIAPCAVTTSARRWQKLGMVKTTAINQLVILAYFLGVPPAHLARWYGSPAQTPMAHTPATPKNSQS